MLQNMLQDMFHEIVHELVETIQMESILLWLSYMPRDVRNKIYIMCCRNYWRQYIPLTAKVPSWYTRKLEIDEELWKSRQENIHIMHLENNCIPENKVYIWGCGCEFCKHTHEKQVENNKLESTLNEYNDYSSRWNTLYEASRPSPAYMNHVLDYTHLVNHGAYLTHLMNKPGLRGNYDTYDPLINTKWCSRDSIHMLQLKQPLYFTGSWDSSESESSEEEV